MSKSVIKYSTSRYGSRSFDTRLELYISTDGCTDIIADGNISSTILNLYLGLCVRSSPTITNYNKYGSSDQCIEGNNGKMCASGSMLCGGNEQAANYVYKITLPGVKFIQTSSFVEDYL